MATTSTLPATELPPPAGETSSGLLVSLGTLSPEALEATLANLAEAFPDRRVEIATPDPAPSTPLPPHLHLTTYTPAAPVPGNWLLTAAEYLNAWKLLDELLHNGRLDPARPSACLLLGPEAHSLSPSALRDLADCVLVSGSDLALPRYDLGPHDGLVNSAILYPVTRALFGTRPRYPLAIDLALSPRMAERLAMAAQKFTAANQNSAIVWPVSEAATFGLSIAEVFVGRRALPAPEGMDLNSVLTQVAGSLFADIDAKASFWQRARLAYTPRAAQAQVESASTYSIDPAELPDVQPMLDSFRLAYSNLHEIWSLVLPPNSLLGLKKLSQTPPESFHMPDSLWARIVYDFILAYRLRTINRGHLLGALTPLYLAWVASHLLIGTNTLAPDQHTEALAAAFEADKPYLVSRWRWPDRFNP